jgi:replicative DNA helicase
LIQLILAKNRAGATGEYNMTFMKAQSKFVWSPGISVTD